MRLGKNVTNEYNTKKKEKRWFTKNWIKMNVWKKYIIYCICIENEPIAALFVGCKNTIKTDCKDGTILYNANTMIVHYSSFSNRLSSSITSAGSRYNFAKDYSTNLIMRLGKNWSKNWKSASTTQSIGKKHSKHKSIKKVSVKTSISITENVSTAY